MVKTAILEWQPMLLPSWAHHTFRAFSTHTHTHSNLFLHAASKLIICVVISLNLTCSYDEQWAFHRNVSPSHGYRKWKVTEVAQWYIFPSLNLNLVLKMAILLPMETANDNDVKPTFLWFRDATCQAVYSWVIFTLTHCIQLSNYQWWPIVVCLTLNED